MEFKLFVTPGLGDNSYLVVSGDEAFLVDPQRDAWRFLSVAEAQKLKVRYVLETHVHWVTPFNSRLILVLPKPLQSSLKEAVTQLIRIGYERIEGYLEGGVEAWRSSGRPVRSYPTAGVDDLCHAYLAGHPMQVLDVRQQGEWEGGHVPNSLHVFVGDLPARLDTLPKDKEVWTACAGGYRSAIAASLLDRAGVPVKVVTKGGVPEWLARCYPQQTTAQA